jgi:hypothetical protein
MDAKHFDALARALSAARPRRGVLAGSLGGVLSHFVFRGTNETRAKPRRLTTRKDPAERLPCPLLRYETKTLIERGRGESASHIDIRGITALVSKDRPARDRHDIGFFPALNAINTAVAKHDVVLRAVSAYRSPKTNKGISSATTSNHLAGHAIDFDFVYKDAAGKSHTCDWPCVRDMTKKKRPCLLNNKGQSVRKPNGCLERARDAAGTRPGTTTPGMQSLPESVLAAILEVEKAGYRWGGRFASGAGFDPIHFDDNLSKRDPDTWKRLAKRLLDAETYLKTHKRVCPERETCNTNTGECECEAGIDCAGDRVLDPETCDCVCAPVSCDGGQEQDPETCECVDAVCRARNQGARGEIEVEGRRCGQQCCGPCETCKTVRNPRGKKRKTCVACPGGTCDPDTGRCGDDCCPNRDACIRLVDACMVDVDDDYCDCQTRCHREGCCHTCPCDDDFSTCTSECWDPVCFQACEEQWHDGWDKCLRNHGCVSDRCGNCASIRFRPQCVLFECGADTCGGSCCPADEHCCEDTVCCAADEVCVTPCGIAGAGCCPQDNPDCCS